MDTLNQEIVERGELKNQYELDISNRVKDGIRQYAIQDIVLVLGQTIINNYQSLSKVLIK
jgi:hypothetical protein